METNVIAGALGIITVVSATVAAILGALDTAGLTGVYGVAVGAGAAVIKQDR